MKKKFKLSPPVLFHGIADKGMAVGRDAEGKVYFGTGVVPGDIARLSLGRKKKGFSQGRAEQIIDYSMHRVAAPCRHFELCGGCKWQNLDYAEQLRQKERSVYDVIRRVGKVGDAEFLPILPAEEPYYYRNKLEFTFSNKRWLTDDEAASDETFEERNGLGFHRPGAFDKVLDIDECLLQADPSNAVRQHTREIARRLGIDFYDIRQHRGILRNLVVRSSSLGQCMVILVVRERTAGVDKLMSELLDRVPAIDSLYVAINTKLNDVWIDQPLVHIHGAEYLEEKLGDLRYRINPRSFFQTNTRQAKRLYDVVVDFADFHENEKAVDLYTGLGSIALYIAGKVSEVVGIETIPEAIEDAKLNASLNGIDNAHFYTGDVRDIFDEAFLERHGKPDILITDPPRAGMHEDVVEQLRRSGIPRIVYVSCNPATQARDIQMLGGTYRVEKLRPVDLFPHTHHVESVALLSL